MMAGNKTKLQADIKAVITNLATFNGQGEQTQNAAIEKFSKDLAQAISDYTLTLVIQATPAQVTAATMLAGGIYPVVATNILDSKVIEQ